MSVPGKRQVKAIWMANDGLDLYGGLYAMDILISWSDQLRDR